MKVPPALAPYAGLAVVAGIGLVFVSWWLKGGAQWVAQRVTDAAPEGSPPAATLVAGTAGAIGEVLGLPTPRQISENRDLCEGATGLFDASVQCGVPDLVRWIRGDFGVGAYTDETDRLLTRYPAPF